MNNYFYIDAKGQQCGPVAGEELKNLGLTNESLVWCEGMCAWAKAAEVAELQPLFAPPPTSPAPPTPPAPPAPKVSQTPQHQSGPRQNDFKREVCPNNYLVWAILVTIMCGCWPLGIPAIVKASKVEGLWYSGFKVEALEKANSAKKWCWATVICSIVWIVINFVVMFFAFVLSEV